MKTACIILLLVALLCSPSYAKSLREADIPKDMQSILKGFLFDTGDPGWKAQEDLTLSGVSVYCGSAYCAFDEPTGKQASYTEVAEQIRDGIEHLYNLAPTHSGSGGISPSGDAISYGEAEFTLTAARNDEDDPGAGNEAISFTVRVVPLRESKIGIILTYVHVQPKAAEPARKQ